jgi:plasmid stabilization system protein ParE
VSHVIITETAGEGLERCRRFLEEKNPRAAKRAAEVIEKQFELLETAPDIGRPLPENPEVRELVISFGDSGYIALYQYNPNASDTAYILAFRHQREAGYFLH